MCDCKCSYKFNSCFRIINVQVIDISRRIENANLVGIEFLSAEDYNNIEQIVNSVLAEVHEDEKISEAIYNGPKGNEGLEEVVETNRKRDGRRFKQQEANQGSTLEQSSSHGTPHIFSDSALKQ